MKEIIMVLVYSLGTSYNMLISNCNRNFYIHILLDWVKNGSVY